ncbi:MAG: hypothetical protein ACKVH7_15630, partial [Alphaproteobacteria bacterium]
MEQVLGTSLLRGADGVLYQISAAACHAVDESQTPARVIAEDASAGYLAGWIDFSSSRMTIDPS